MHLCGHDCCSLRHNDVLHLMTTCCTRNSCRMITELCHWVISTVATLPHTAVTYSINGQNLTWSCLLVMTTEVRVCLFSLKYQANVPLPTCDQRHSLTQTRVQLSVQQHLVHTHSSNAHSVQHHHTAETGSDYQSELPNR
jgi:hypothetical protein